MRTMLVVLAALSLAATSAPTTGPVVREARFEKEITKRVQVPYLVYLPKNYGKGQKAPLLVFLHGSGECGTDFKKLKWRGPAQFYSVDQEMPFVMVYPLCPSEVEMWQVESLNLMLDEVLKKYEVDEERIYLTGLSMGAYGVWTWACHDPQRFAAIAPLAGEGNDDLAPRLKHVPVWAFHGALDPAVSLAEEERMVKAVQRAGGNAKLTVYVDGKHDIWTRTYGNPELYQWLLNHRRVKPSP
jgi:predicted peptidase